ncbi:MAG: hypothetical protein COU06_01120 [Candidatus Harrisonbacteria bacterium CG10_big_fil_rev_8_21_14_0_10_38_8]|uniref:NYN domain-containing protein n=1 Tax=Candidatus Harrisonbacteria bacterium CG10_big_fil_rev_8_21_14_0_10_38_8 TaxID=1974582 RepID=A0A2M6WK79_9BACT|nr:MAG: hypothetical protein COU06_01120 [Candidatus Harrisonbacteria bacterium CG10_big_fil_rev_8_21_14_0_10_38_8]
MKENMHDHQRVGIFIDVQNLYHSAKNLYGSRVNYQELISSVMGERKLIRALAYVVKTEDVLEDIPKAKGVKSESSFFDALKTAGLELRSKDIQLFPDGSKKADWDVGMAIDAVRMASSLDVIILVTGDGDFVPLVEYLKWGKGVEVEVAGFSRTSNATLKEVADKFISLEDIPKLLIKKSGERGKVHQVRNKK